MIVLETTGRKTGRTHNVPLLATRAGRLLVVSTVRRRSEWLKNLAANTEVSYWMGGRPAQATAFVIAQGVAAAAEALPPSARCLAGALAAHSRLFGTGFAILVPRRSQTEVV
jgi:deazaflavin-dependent oxidoreductase (nitroreductase family)